MNLFLWREKPLKTVWRVEKGNRAGLLVGTAHFSPCSFRRSLRRLVREAQNVLFEGPLDQESMDEVVRYGRQGEGCPSLYDALDPAVIEGINALLAPRLQAATTAAPYLDLLWGRREDGFLELHARGVRPWMAFFTTWTAFLDWRHSMDLEAFQIAGRLGKRIGYLETIPDQLAALDGIPFARIVHYFNLYRHWGEHREHFNRVFFEGNPEKFLSTTGEFPTRCESIIGRRDPVFFEGIRSALEQGPTTAFVGVGHTPGVRELFLADGYRVIQATAC
jgi:hypothetical protein